MGRMLRTIAALCAAATTMFAAPSLSLRLQTTLTSYRTATGSEFHGVVIAPYLQNGKVLLPNGTIVRGKVRGVKPVGFAAMRERAWIQLDFDEYQLPDGRRFPMQGTLRRIENARETVTAEGDVKGILAANNPQSFIAGVWHLPNQELFSRSFIGLTGAGGRIFSAYSLGPIGGVALFAARCALFRLPEPEIRLPAGVELRVAVSSLPPDAPSFAASEPATVPADLAAWIREQPTAVSKLAGTPSDDMINMVFRGSREDLGRAFHAAGWFEAERQTTRSLSRTYKAYTAQAGYMTAPVSTLLYDGNEPDVVFEKSFNTISKRHHIRVWRAEDGLWLAAATHDVGVRFDTGVKFTHMIHPNIDWERAKVINDLTFAGCIGPAGFVEREDAIRRGDDANGVVTDGRAAVVYLQSSCTGPQGTFSSEMPTPPHNHVFRMARRMMLEGRQYVLRGNPYYLVYRMLTIKREQRQHAYLEE
jgi:hypothetical protein